MEKFKQLQQEKVPAAAADRSKSSTSATPSVALKPSVIVNKRLLEVKVNDTKKGSTLTSGGKLAFSLKQKSKVAATPVKFVTDDEEEEAAEAEVISGDEPIKRQKLGQRDIIQSSSQQQDVGESSGPSSADPIAMMEFYMKKAAQEERIRQPKQSKDEMPPPASLQGEGLGSDKRGRADPVMAGDVKKDNLGVGAQKPGEVTPDDDIYEQYKKRMMLGYRHRPNPLRPVENILCCKQARLTPSFTVH
ncbi:hypothetical protein BHE74_00015821 [Ensete ventricosum]|nr:hypothetical protein GW17_00018450 [Ensete ventricosum]RWW76116.1 hypothetical protein BHE74_00015821 [Ensete ventricosum]RZR81152.1 hypothetical protein BHM03_00007334 [Ensete ventricosum]